MSNLPPAMVDAAATAAVTAVVGSVTYLLHVARKVKRTAGTMLRDWEGEPARPGVAARPGVMVRLHAIETGQDDMRAEIAEIRHEVKPNSGRSMRDSVAAIHEATTGRPDPGMEEGHQ